MKSYKSVFSKYGFDVLAACDDNEALPKPTGNEGDGEEAPKSSKGLMITYSNGSVGDFTLKLRSTSNYNVIVYKDGAFKFDTNAFVGLLLFRFFEKGNAEKIASDRGEEGNVGQYVTLDKKAISFLKDNCNDHRYYFINDRVYDIYRARNVLMRKLHAYASKVMVRDMEVGLANLALVEIADSMRDLGCFCGVETSLHVVKKESKHITKGKEQRKYDLGNSMLLICDVNDYSKVSAKAFSGIAAHLKRKIKKQQGADGLFVSKKKLAELIESHGFRFNLIKKEEDYFEVEIAPKVILSVEIVENDGDEVPVVAIKQEVGQQFQVKAKVKGYSSDEDEILKIVKAALILANE